MKNSNLSLFPENINKQEEAQKILEELGLPEAQLNERSALTFLALLNLKPDQNWENIENPLMGVTPIMQWINTFYNKKYAANTREAIRRQTLHQFVDGGVVAYNPDRPDRPPNSPKACYQILPELKEVLSYYGTKEWRKHLDAFLRHKETLVEQYAMARNMSKVPLKINQDKTFYLTPGKHSILIKQIIEVFGPKFVPGAELIYVGDTENKKGYYLKDRMLELGVEIDDKGKFPDVVLYFEKENWLILAESVTSHGPVDGKRYKELNNLFGGSTAGLVFVTAFLDRKMMSKYIADISWETEVWVAEDPEHMIHFNGHKFLGPY
ncbi:BsuBI/PstI family type II restriction endonuclease [Aquimarina hainanensis]|uniref:BsuBI/PstI family type II restriction endonuclease n=1 Tax=Aquimarina hainanensis TaxID=1578017 RepID=A0ABW5NAE6_9FLAO